MNRTKRIEKEIKDKKFKIKYGWDPMFSVIETNNWWNNLSKDRKEELIQKQKLGTLTRKDLENEKEKGEERH